MAIILWVRTGAGDYDGTNDRVYFGMVGDREWCLDVEGRNDFAAGTVQGFIFGTKPDQSLETIAAYKNFFDDHSWMPKPKWIKANGSERRVSNEVYVRKGFVTGVAAGGDNRLELSYVAWAPFQVGVSVKIRSWMSNRVFGVANGQTAWFGDNPPEQGGDYLALKKAFDL